MVDLASFGLDEPWLLQAHEQGADASRLARVSAELGAALEVVTWCGTLHAPLRGAWRHRIRTGLGRRPAVGDWVELEAVGRADEPSPAVARILTPRTLLQRRAAGRAPAPQVLAANVDLALVVCAAGTAVSPRRLERLAALAWSGGIEPIVVVNKCDLHDDAASHVAQAHEAVPEARCFAVSARTGQGLRALELALTAGKTFVLLGSSGVGKSTLVNRWVGCEQQRTGPVSRDGRGRHVTTRRQLIATASGALVIDMPGLREAGLTSVPGGLERAFRELVRLGEACRYESCTHTDEPGCAVQLAVQQGRITPARVAAWLRLRAERDRGGQGRADR